MMSLPYLVNLPKILILPRSCWPGKGKIGYVYGIQLGRRLPQMVITPMTEAEAPNAIMGWTQLGLNPATGRGPRGDARRLREQMQRLFRATISLDRVTRQGVRASNIWLDMQVVSHGEFWWSVRDPSQAALWGSWIELGEKFFEAITAAPVPLDMRVLKALKRSPLALDLYAWLS
jgi:hypothetical protein